MKSIRSMMTIPAFALFATVAACGSQSATDGKGTSTTPVAAQAKDHPPGPHMMGYAGPGMLLFAALREPINLTDAQRKTIEGLVEDLRAKGPPPGAPDRAALAAAIRAGKIDVAALEPKTKPDMTAHNAEVAKALTTLHSTLTSEQRVALVAAVKEHTAEHHGGGPPPEKGEGMKMHHGGPGGGPMHMFADLDLTQAQKDAIKKELDANHPAPPTDAEREEMKKHREAMRTEMDARLDKFASPNFDANAFVAPPANAPPKMGPGFHRDQFLKDLAVVVPILTPAQREKLAQKIEKGPPAPPAAPAK